MGEARVCWTGGRRKKIYILREWNFVKWKTQHWHRRKETGHRQADGVCQRLNKRARQMSEPMKTDDKPESEGDGQAGSEKTETWDSTGWMCIGEKGSYVGKRKEIKVHGRRVTVLQANGLWICLDTICYHAGGPLTEGAVRRVAGRTCLQCPWHSYLVDVATGEGLYLDMNRRYRSKGIRQRVHGVREDKHGRLWVQIRSEGDVASDAYAFGPRFAGRPDPEGVEQFPCPQLDW